VPRNRTAIFEEYDEVGSEGLLQATWCCRVLVVEVDGVGVDDVGLQGDGDEDVGYDVYHSTWD